jgi:hypothetical protein
MCLIAISSYLLDIVRPNPLSGSVPDRDVLAGWPSRTDLSLILFRCPLVRDAFDGTSEILLRVIAGTGILLTGAEETDSILGIDLTPEVIPGRTLPAESGRPDSLVLKLGGLSLGKSGISSGRTGARDLVFGELGRDDGADEGAEFRPLMAKGLTLDVKLLLPEILSTEGEQQQARHLGIVHTDTRQQQARHLGIVHTDTRRQQARHLGIVHTAAAPIRHAVGRDTRSFDPRRESPD